MYVFDFLILLFYFNHYLIIPHHSSKYYPQYPHPIISFLSLPSFIIYHLVHLGIHCFDNVTAIIFVAAISEYDQVLFEDSQTNRLDEALILFDEIAHSRYFEKQSLILFLNKADLFADKIQRVPLQNFFPDYTGPQQDVNAAQAWITQQFKSHVTNKDKQVFSFVTTATSSDNVNSVFKAVQATVIQHALKDIGLK